MGSDSNVYIFDLDSTWFLHSFHETQLHIGNRVEIDF